MFEKKINFRHFYENRQTESKQNFHRIKKQKSIIIAQFGILIFFGGYFTGLPSSSGEDIEMSNPIGMFNSEHIVQNLKGDTLTIYKYWKVLPESLLHVNILNPRSVSEESIDIIKNTITSQESIKIEDNLMHKGPKNSFTTYYLGWKGALEFTPDTKIPIPKNFKITNVPESNADITIILSNLKDRSGNAGYTKTVVEGNQIVKAFITIYNVNSLSTNELETIMRHEFGHALGLGHTTAPEDLMAPVIDMTYPFISHCNILAITELYNENSESKVVCEK